MSPSLLVTCAFLAISANGPFPSFDPPKFYADNYCQDPGTDPRFATLGYRATGDDIIVRPFASPGWFNWFAIGVCLYDYNSQFSVMLTLDDTMCPSTATKVLKLSYWQYRNCDSNPYSVTTLTVGTCVQTPLGSAIFNPGVKLNELCVMTNYRTAMATGGLRTQSWLGDSCQIGLPVVDQVVTFPGGKQPCGARPMCNGCCRVYDPKSCDATPGNTFNRAITACKDLGGGKWDMAVADLTYSDDQCTMSLDSASPFLGTPIQPDTCITVSAQLATASVKLTFEAPLTTDIYCKYVELNTNRSVAGFLTWDEFNKLTASGASTSAHPAVSVLGLALLFVTVLLF